ncbi:MAG: hypothetical protein IKN81_00250 [Oscillospiraceae bacterium]|nr:hypothetical protein [Oscillospiraceae bacterium]
MEKTYRIGVRFRKLKYFSVAINCAIVFAFYFIYRYVFSGVFPGFVGAPLALVFLLLGVLVGRVTLIYADKYASGIEYRVTEKGLYERTGKREQTYAWEEFTGAKLQEFQFRGVFPVEFQVRGKPMMLHQSVDGLCELTAEVFKRIAPYAVIDPELVERAEQMRGVY